MLVKGGQGKRGEWGVGVPPREKPLLSPIHSPVPTTPLGLSMPPTPQVIPTLMAPRQKP